MTVYYGTIQDNGQIQVEGDLAQDAGKRVLITVVDGPDIEQGITGAEILASGLVGMWEDREDIVDSVEFAEKLRRNWEQRSDRD
jgi:hypothetical protein